jgi:hypothetical protein
VNHLAPPALVGTTRDPTPPVVHGIFEKLLEGTIREDLLGSLTSLQHRKHERRGFPLLKLERRPHGAPLPHFDRHVGGSEPQGQPRLLEDCPLPPQRDRVTGARVVKGGQTLDVQGHPATDGSDVTHQAVANAVAVMYRHKVQNLGNPLG